MFVIEAKAYENLGAFWTVLVQLYWAYDAQAGLMY